MSNLEHFDYEPSDEEQLEVYILKLESLMRSVEILQRRIAELRAKMTLS